MSPIREVEITKADSSVDGVVVAGLEGIEYMSDSDIIYIDQGEKSGLKKGNVLTVYSKAAEAVDPYKGKKFKLPLKEIGKLVVAQVYDTTSACLVIHSIAGINRGDSVQTLQNAK